MNLLIRQLTAFSVMGAVVGTTVPAQAVTLTLDNSWTDFSWSGGEGAVATPTFQFTVAPVTRVRFDVTDAFFSGDEFQVVDSTLGTIGFTSDVPPDPDFFENDPDTAFSDPNFSSGSFLLDPGNYDISLIVAQAATSFPDGVGFVRAESVPIPFEMEGTLGLLALGAIFGGKKLWNARQQR